MIDKPDWEQDGVQLYLGDCLEILPTLEAGSVDAVVTSPPYNIRKGYDLVNDYRDDYIDWLVGILREAARITRDALWVNLGYRKLDMGNLPIAFQIWNRVGMFLMQAIKWQYGSGLTYRKRFNHRSEDWLWFVKTPQEYTFNPDDVRDLSLTKYQHDKRNNPNGKLPSDIWYFPHVAGTFAEREDHPAQYPCEMIERIIRATTDPGMIVIDPFMGSGTTGVACVKTGRSFIGIEIDEGYFEIAKQRIAEAQMQPRLEGLE